MTAREAKQLLGKVGALAVGKLTFLVKIEDAREVFGRPELLVTPVAGKGSAWKGAQNVKVSKGGKA